jgi:outer membrane protein TolC
LVGSSILLLATLAPTYAGATPKELTLEDAIQNALSRNPEVLATKEGLDASQHAVWSARLAFAPSASINSSVTRVDERTFRVANESLDGLREILEIAVPDQEFDIEPFLYRNTYRTNFQVRLPIYNGGRLWVHVQGQARRDRLSDARCLLRAPAGKGSGKGRSECRRVGGGEIGDGPGRLRRRQEKPL